MERREPDWVIGEFLTRQNTGFILGEPKKANKSWLILAALWDLAEGKSLWGVHHPRRPRFLLPPRPIRSVYFAQEDTLFNVKDRVDAMGHWREPTQNLRVVPKDWALLIDQPTGRRLIRSILDGLPEKPDLLVFDTFRRVMAGSENDSATIAAMYKYVDSLGHAYNCATLFAHHIVKPPHDKDSEFDYSDPFIGRGSGDIYGGGDAFINIKPVTKDESGARVTLFFDSKRAAQPNPIIVEVRYPPIERADWVEGERYGECKVISFVGEKELDSKKNAV